MIKRKILAFKSNFNGKLGCTYFTSIRKSWQWMAGDEVLIVLKGKTIAEGVVVDVKRVPIEKISPWMSYLDTGYGVEETRQMIYKMYPGTGPSSEMKILLIKITRRTNEENVQ